jgi:hypothetical protein
MRKKLILGLPAVYGLGTLIKENLQLLGFEVLDLSFDYRGFVYKNAGQRLNNLIRKTIFGDKSYKDKLRFKAQQQLVLDKLNLMTEKADYALIIRPDTYSAEVLQHIKQKAEISVAYQWDGMDRFPWVEKYVPLFDRFFVFDPHDIHFKDFHFPYLGNFYFTLPRLLQVNHPAKKEAYFLGAFNRDRKAILEVLHPLLTKAAVSPRFLLYSRKKRKAEAGNPCFTLTQEVYTYEQNIAQVKNAEVIIDLTIDCHKGLSLRFFEAICFNKKLITNNGSIRYYDFYHPDNIFIYGEDDLNTLEAFIQKPYQEIQSAIIQKYSFANWIHYALDLPPYTPIPSPELP